MTLELNYRRGSFITFIHSTLSTKLNSIEMQLPYFKRLSSESIHCPNEEANQIHNAGKVQMQDIQ